MQLKGIAFRKQRGANMIETKVTTIDPVTGVEGDYGRKAGKATITILSEEAWNMACFELNTDLHWTTRRANLLISSYTFSSEDVGKQLQIGDVTLEITRETNPCDLMETAHAGLFDALSPDWRGGVRAKVIQGGDIKVGDTLRWAASQ
jgi:MOSC domain-containing protein YiiM